MFTHSTTFHSLRNLCSAKEVDLNFILCLRCTTSSHSPSSASTLSYMPIYHPFGTIQTPGSIPTVSSVSKASSLVQILIHTLTILFFILPYLSPKEYYF